MTVTGRITGWFLVASSAGGVLLPWLIGQYLESVGTRVVMIAITTDLALAILIWAALAFGDRSNAGAACGR
jgi:fucose permease